MITSDNQSYKARQFERHDTSLCAMMVQDGQSFACQMINVSVSGARVHAEQRFAPGLCLKMAIYPFGEFSCQIIWQKDRNLGIKFLEPQEMMAGVIQAMVLF